MRHQKLPARAGSLAITALAAALLAAQILLPGARVSAGIYDRSGGTMRSSQGALYEYVKGLSVAPDGRAWAVGAYWPTAAASNILMERWNGRAWRLVTGPDLGGSVSSSDLADVAVVSRSRAWAVGSVTDGGVITQTLIERWNGKAWRRVGSPSPGGAPGVSSLAGVTALSLSSAWAVGYYTHVSLVHGSADRTLVEHWNGRTWKRSASPNPGGQFGSYLVDVAAASARDAWAVGRYVDRADHDQTLIEHWNGRSWARTPSPNPAGPSQSNLLFDVAALSRSNAWAVGAYATPSGIRSLIERWNGRAWRQVRSPNPEGSASSFLYAVAVLSPANAWAAGTYVNRGGQDQTLIEHWNGKKWSQVPSPNPGGATRRNLLSAVAALSPGEVWAAGFYDHGPGQERTLIERWNGRAWQDVPSPSR